MHKLTDVKKLLAIFLSGIFYVHCHSAAPAFTVYVPEETVGACSPIFLLGTLFSKKVYLYNNEILRDDRFAPISPEDRERFLAEKCRLYAPDDRNIEKFKRAFKEVCDNPIGCRLIKEIMALLDMPFFRNIKINFCYDVKDDTCILGPLDEVGEGSLRAQIKEAWHRFVLSYGRSRSL
ncbi:MAG: hypothetical protein LBD60_00070 [Puniceicoccales bacterium]|nr:hypothetical protein [Puniceicoccales bacterium]